MSITNDGNPSPWEGTWVTSDTEGMNGVKSLSDWNETWPDESKLGTSDSGFPPGPDREPGPIPGINLPSPGDYDADSDDYHE
jgi:hypothetical protein